MGTVSRNGLFRLLIVDDDDGFAELLSTVLECDGRFHVLARARNGIEAVGLADALEPDAVLMDIDMPVMDGFEATGRIRRRRPQIPVVVVSGFDSPERALEAHQAGAVDHLSKARLGMDFVEELLLILASAVSPKAPAVELAGRR